MQLFCSGFSLKLPVFTIVHILAGGPAVHLVEDEQEQSRDDESDSCHEETHPVITHLVNEEAYTEREEPVSDIQLLHHADNTQYKTMQIKKGIT